MTYFEWLIIFFGIPIFIFFLFDKNIFWQNKKIFYKVMSGGVIFGLPWDYIAIKNNVWSFPQGLSNIYLFSIPIEEYIFAIMLLTIITFFTLFQLKYYDK
ncbi:MAG: lycopene cyclase domain-containing protein [bacterium]|nr:lycopene cyclase domain-containing protein [bacterium]